MSDASGSTIPIRLQRPLLRPLLRWYRRHHRDLPWRRTRDPYAVWVSEVMLQQTRVEVVLPYYRRFLARFPTVRALARAPESAVLAAWSGLGYYSRARHLREAARQIVAAYGGRLPRTAGELAHLPGFGRYTAGAVASIAFGERAPVVDGNVARVLARLFALRGEVRSARVARRLWTVADGLVPERAPGEWNQALMELGATLCTPREPRCGSCPVRRVCSARRRGLVARLPTPPRRPPTIAVRRAAAVVERAGRVLLLRRDEGRLLRGLWEFPDVTLADGASATPALRGLLAGLGLRISHLEERGVIRHTITIRRIETRVFVGRVVRGRASPAVRSPRRIWVPPARLRELPLSTVGLQIATLLDGRRQAAHSAIVTKLGD